MHTATSTTADPPSLRLDTSTTPQRLSIGACAGIGVGAGVMAIPHNPPHEKYQEMTYYPSAAPAKLYAGNAAVEIGLRDPAESGIRQKTLAQERPYDLDDPKVILQPEENGELSYSHGLMTYARLYDVIASKKIQDA